MSAGVTQFFRRLWLRFAVIVLSAVVLSYATSSIVLSISHEIIHEHWIESLPEDVREQWRALDERRGNLDENAAAELADMRAIYAAHPNEAVSDEIYIAAYLIANFAGLLIILLLAGWSVRRFLLPVRAVAEAARQVTNGDLSARAVPSGLSSDELTGLVNDFNKMASSLDRHERERTQAAAAVAHELRTPVAILHARIAALKDGVIPTTPEEYERLLTKTDLLARIVEDLRVVSLAEAGNLAIEARAVDLAEIARETVVARQAAAGVEGMRIEIDLEAALCWSDDARIRQVTGNLVDNALYHAAEGGVVRVETSLDGEYALLRVMDRGPGIPENRTAHLFEPFQRAGDAHALWPGGSGLGLTIVKVLVESQQGSVSAWNREGGGACFEIRLPRRNISQPE